MCTSGSTLATLAHRSGHHHSNKVFDSALTARNHSRQLTHRVQRATDNTTKRIPSPIVEPIPEIIKSFLRNELCDTVVEVRVKLCRQDTAFRCAVLPCMAAGMKCAGVISAPWMTDSYFTTENSRTEEETIHINSNAILLTTPAYAAAPMFQAELFTTVVSYFQITECVDRYLYYMPNALIVSAPPIYEQVLKSRFPGRKQTPFQHVRICMAYSSTTGD